MKKGKMLTDRIFILGAPDPEMSIIETLLREQGLTVAYATDEKGVRVHPGNAYRAMGFRRSDGSDKLDYTGKTVLVECGFDPAAGHLDAHVVHRIDHHRPGDPGYGRPPSEFLPASSLGQVWHCLAMEGLLDPYSEGMDARVGVEDLGVQASPPYNIVNNGFHCPTWVGTVPHDHVLAAAADHCLHAAYRGECPGVDPDALMAWRIQTRAAFQGRPEAEVLADVERARETLAAAPQVTIGSEQVADLRGQQIPELPEAAARDGKAFVARLTDRDGRVKVVLQGASAETLRSFLDQPPFGLVDVYGDPARGFAGGYES